MDAGAKLSFSYMRHKSVCKMSPAIFDVESFYLSPYFFLIFFLIFGFGDGRQAVMQIVEQSV